MGIFKRAQHATSNASELNGLVSDGALVVDVRTPGEWAAGHLPFAVHIPMDALNTRAAELDPGRLTVFVCRSGNRSGSAAKAFASHGYRVSNLTGGMRSCARAGLPVVRDDGSPGAVI